MTNEDLMNLSNRLCEKIEGLKFLSIAIDLMPLDKNFSASVFTFSYKGDEIDIVLGRDDEGDVVSLPQDLKINYNFRPHEIDKIKESIERCLKNGWGVSE